MSEVIQSIKMRLEDTDPFGIGLFQRIEAQLDLVRLLTKEGRIAEMFPYVYDLVRTKGKKEYPISDAQRYGLARQGVVRVNDKRPDVKDGERPSHWDVAAGTDGIYALRHWKTRLDSQLTRTHRVRGQKYNLILPETIQMDKLLGHDANGPIGIYHNRLVIPGSEEESQETPYAGNISTALMGSTHDYFGLTFLEEDERHRTRLEGQIACHHNGEPLYEVSVPGSVNELCTSGDGRIYASIDKARNLHLVIGAMERTAEIKGFNELTGDELFSLEIPTSYISGLAVSGTTLFAAVNEVGPELVSRPVLVQYKVHEQGIEETCRSEPLDIRMGPPSLATYQGGLFIGTCKGIYRLPLP